MSGEKDIEKAILGFLDVYKQIKNRKFSKSIKSENSGENYLFRKSSRKSEKADRQPC